jgi:hypothetical protein
MYYDVTCLQSADAREKGVGVFMSNGIQMYWPALKHHSPVVTSSGDGKDQRDAAVHDSAN